MLRTSRQIIIHDSCFSIFSMTSFIRFSQGTEQKSTLEWYTKDWSTKNWFKIGSFISIRYGDIRSWLDCSFCKSFGHHLDVPSLYINTFPNVSRVVKSLFTCHSCVGLKKMLILLTCSLQYSLLRTTQYSNIPLLILIWVDEKGSCARNLGDMQSLLR